MKFLRYVVSCSATLFAFAYSGSAFAADPLPGAACTIANAHVRSGGPETSGIIYQLTCISSVWVPTMTYLANSNVGIGTTSPSVPLHIISNVGSAVAHPYRVGTMVEAEGTNVARVGVLQYSDTQAPIFAGFRAKNTKSSPQALVEPDILLQISGYGYDSSAFAQGAAIQFSAQQAWTTGSHGADITFLTTDAGSVALPSVRMTLHSDGRLGLGTAYPNAMVAVGGDKSAVSWTTSGKYIAAGSGILTDTTGSGTIATRAGSSFGVPTFAASNSQTITNAATLYLAGAPAQGANVTITNSHALYVAGGSSTFNGRLVGAASSDTDALSSITLDFSATNMIQVTGASAACGTLNFTNVVAGGNYTVTIPNATATCTTVQLNGATTNRKLPSGYTGGVAAAGLVYTAIYDGTTLWVSYVPF